MTVSGVLLFVRKVRESANTREPCLHLSSVIGILSVRMNIVLVCAVFLLVFWIMISHIPACTRVRLWVRSLGREYPLVEEMAPHSSILAWKIP